MQSRLRPYIYYDSTQSLCPHCLRRIDAKIIFQKGRVWMLKRCPTHGPQQVLLADDIDYYKQSREVYLKIPQQVARYNTQVRYGCPYDCGICPDHEQHGCTLLLEITDNCNLKCPTCFAGSCPENSNHLPLKTVERMLDRAISNEIEPDILQISGGEPTIHPEFWHIMDAIKTRPIKHFLLNTNGIEIAKSELFAKRLANFCPGFEVYLQFDSLSDKANQVLRGASLVSIRQQALQNLNKYGVPTTLVCTLRQGVNDHELGDIIAFAQSIDCVRGVTVQPVQGAGRLENDYSDAELGENRLTISAVRRKILQQSNLFSPADIIPVPCNADSLAMAYAVKVKTNSNKPAQFYPLSGLIDPQVLLGDGGNTIAYENDPAITRHINQLFSTHHSPFSQNKAMHSLLTLFSKNPKFEYDNIFRVLIVDFMDAYNFDLRSVRKSCVHILHPDGKRVIPFETYNLLYRDKLEEEKLTPLRRELMAREEGQLNGAISARHISADSAIPIINQNDAGNQNHSVAADDSLI